MRNTSKLSRDTVILTGAGLLMRCIGMGYQVWLAGTISSAGMGLWQLVMSVCALSATLAISGIRFTTIRLVSEELGSGHAGSVRAAVNRCITYAALFGLCAFLCLFLGAERIGFLWIGDARTVKSLKIISFTMPMISVSSVLNGYFIASGRAWKSALIQVIEQLLGVAAAVWMVSAVDRTDLSACCGAISGANLTADLVSLLLSAVLYCADTQNKNNNAAPPRLTARMLRIASPLALSAYARTGLTTAEHLLIPQNLRKSGLSAGRALSGYGTVTGMVFPVLGFPSCILGAAAELIVPELTAAQVRGDERRIRETVCRLLRKTLVYSLSVAAALFLLSDAIGNVIYKNADAGYYLRMLSPLVPIMYLDMITDGCLKGLGQMMWSMCFNISEALIGIFLVVFLLPQLALTGYIIMIYFCEVYNFFLSFSRLRTAANLGKRQKNTG